MFICAYKKTGKEYIKILTVGCGVVGGFIFFFWLIISQLFC